MTLKLIFPFCTLYSIASNSDVATSSTKNFNGDFVCVYYVYVYVVSHSIFFVSFLLLLLLLLLLLGKILQFFNILVCQL